MAGRCPRLGCHTTVGSLDGEGAYATVDVLDLLQPQVDTRERKRPGRIAMGILREAYAAWLGKSLKAGSDVDAVSEEVARPNDDVSDMDADPKAQTLLVVSRSRVRLFNGALNDEGAPHRIHDARELGEDAVACRVGDPPAVLGDEAIGDPRQASRAAMVPCSSSRIIRE